MEHIRLLFRVSNVFLFLLGCYACFMSHNMLASMYGPINVELESMNRYFGLALMLSCLFLYKLIELNKNNFFISCVMTIFFGFNVYFLDSGAVQLTLGPLLIFFRIIIYFFTFSFFMSSLYISKNKLSK